MARIMIQGRFSSPQACALCGACEFAPFLVKYGKQVVQCCGCALIFVSPLAEEAELRQLYQSEYVLPIDVPRRLLRGYQQVLARIERFTRPCRLLDVGCAFGSFLLIAQKRGWEVEGVEPSMAMARYARDRFGLRVYDGTLVSLEGKLPAEAFRLVTIFHVLEHMRDPVGELRRVRQLLRSEGVLAVRVPNIEALLFKLLGKYWSWITLDYHLYYFSPTSLARLVKQAGYRVLFCQTRLGDFEHEILEVLKGGLAFLGIYDAFKRRFQRGAPSIYHDEGPANRFPRYAYLLKTLLAVSTKPFFVLTLPLWQLAARWGRGAEIFLLAQKE